MSFGSCDDCPLRGQTEVPYRGNTKSKIVFCGESPGSQEIEQGKPFVGAAGKKQKAYCKEAGFNFDDCYIINSARCLINKDEFGDPDIRKILQCCRPNVERALKAIKPKCIVALGDIANRQITGRRKISKHQGRWYWSDEFKCWVMATYHPASVFRTPKYGALIQEDTKQVADFKARGYSVPQKDEEKCEYEEVRSITPFFEEFKDRKVLIGLDTETQGLDWMQKNPVIICYSFSWHPNKAYVVRLMEECSIKDAEFTVDVKRVPEGKVKKIDTKVGVRRCEGFNLKIFQLRKLCWHKNVFKVLQNGKFDIHFIDKFVQGFDKKRGFRPIEFTNFYADTQALAQLHDENLFSQARLELLQRHFTKFKDDYWRRFEDLYNKDDMIGVPKNALIEYSAKDAIVTRRVAMYLLKELKKNKRLKNYFFNVVQPIINNILFTLETNGFKASAKDIEAVGREIEDDVELYHNNALAISPKSILKEHKNKGLSLTRRALVSDILFDGRGFGIPGDIVKQTKKSKRPSIDKESLQTLLYKRGVGNKVKRFIEIYRRWQTNHTLLTRYIRGFEKWIKHDGRIHCQYSIVTTVTGRSSSKEPNMQNNPKRSEEAKKIRKLLIPGKGNILIAVDLSQAELRFMAHCANEQNMIRVFKRGLDIHSATTEGVFGKKLKTLSEAEASKLRFYGKTLNLALVYGMSAQKFVVYMRTEANKIIEEDQAKEWRKYFFNLYPKLNDYYRAIEEYTKQHEQIISPFGRYRRLPNINSPDKALRNAALRQAINFPTQEMSSSTVLIAANELIADGSLNPDEIRPIAFVHDELIFECVDKNSIIERNAKEIIQHMENPPLYDLFGFKLRVPLKADCKIGPNASEMKELEL